MLNLAVILSALGCGLVAGVFYAFSTFVMKALGNLPPAQGIAAMQSINVVVINPWFLLVFVGTAMTCVLVIITSVLRWHAPGAPYLIAGSLLYVVGTFAVTMLANVPLNDALANVEPSSTEGAGCGAAISRPGQRGITCEPSRRSPPQHRSPSRSFSTRAVHIDEFSLNPWRTHVNFDLRQHRCEEQALCDATKSTTFKDPQDHGFMYAHGFEDLDGHIWELIHIVPSASG